MGSILIQMTDAERPQVRNVDLLFEVGALRWMPRMWERFLSPDFANISEHSFRVAIIAMMIAASESADTGKVAKMALTHDIQESRTGDADYAARHHTKRDETGALHDMLKGTSLEEELLNLYEEYEAKETLEARCVKDADNLDVDLEIREQDVRGHNLNRIWAANRFGIRENLYTETAKKIWDQIQRSDPHEWHVAIHRNHQSKPKTSS